MKLSDLFILIKMHRNIKNYLIALPAFLIIFGNCSTKKTEISWDQNFPVIGSQSSPRTADLNQDGVLDIIMGAGKNEYQECDQGILAIDGKTGELLWEQHAIDQVFGSATFYDISGDGIPDIVIGGRSNQLKALDGSNGEIIWMYQYQYENDPILKYANRNFYNSVLVPDQNEDGLPELMVQNGGNPKADPYSLEGRTPGVLMLLDLMTGSVIAADTMPDGRESYMSAVSFTQPDDKEPWILFGSGGETLSGNLYLAKISDLFAGKLSNAKIIASEEDQGFIAPPVLADINQDGFLDIVAISHRSTIYAIDGRSLLPLWKQNIENTESSNSFAVGYFTGDAIPDFFTFVSIGQWPDNTGSLQILLDGRNGDIVYIDSLGCTGFSSPVVYDLDGDNWDEAILSINEFDCHRGFINQQTNQIENRLIIIDFKRKVVSEIERLPKFKNIFSTPWIGDMDRDGYLDIVHCQYYHPTTDPMLFLGMRIKRISTNVRVDQSPAWGAYMGSLGNGIFLSNK